MLRLGRLRTGLRAASCGGLGDFRAAPLCFGAESALAARAVLLGVARHLRFRSPGGGCIEARPAGEETLVSNYLTKGVISVDRSKDRLVDLASALSGKLGEAHDLPEQLQEAALSNPELKLARRMARRIHRFRGDVIQLRHDLEDREI